MKQKAKALASFEKRDNVMTRYFQRRNNESALTKF